MGIYSSAWFFTARVKKTRENQEASERVGILSPELQIEMFISQQVVGLDECGRVMFNSLCCAADQTK